MSEKVDKSTSGLRLFSNDFLPFRCLNLPSQSVNSLNRRRTIIALIQIWAW